MSRIAETLGKAYALAAEQDDSHVDGKLTMSGIGGCLRRSAYQVAGVKATNVPPVNRAAWHGTWLHEPILPLMASLIPGARTEESVTLEHAGLTIKGRFDLFAAPTLVDLKTVSDSAMAWVRSKGISVKHLYQTGGYAQALTDAGEKVEEIAILYLNRGNGEEEVLTHEFGPNLTEEIHQRMERIADAAEDPDNARREERGPGLSIVCDSCDFLTRCWGVKAVSKEVGVQAILASAGPEAITDALALYAAGSATEKAGKADRAFARAILTETDNGTYGDWTLRWSETARSELDTQAVVDLLQAQGIEAPMRSGKSRVISVKQAKKPA